MSKEQYKLKKANCESVLKPAGLVIWYLDCPACNECQLVSENTDFITLHFKKRFLRTLQFKCTSKGLLNQEVEVVLILITEVSRAFANNS